jgi:hypothetical protein
VAGADIHLYRRQQKARPGKFLVTHHAYRDELVLADSVPDLHIPHALVGGRRPAKKNASP